MSDEAVILEEQVTQYLRSHPKFFEQYPALLADMYIPSPHGSGTVSLAERQQLAQRDKIRVLDAKLAELLQFGKENDAISAKVHTLSVALLSSGTLSSIVDTATKNLRQDFAVPYAGLRLWAKPKHTEDSELGIFNAVGEELRIWAAALTDPYCGKFPELAPGMALDDWFKSTDFTGAGEAQSFAIIPLATNELVGLLTIASDEASRFYPGMGTMYLNRIGQLISAALTQHIE